METIAKQQPKQSCTMDEFVIVESAPSEVIPVIINGLVTADFTDYDIVSEFPNFMSVNNLQVIRMSTNELGNIPDEFCKMKCLKQLYLFGDRIRPGNGLTSLPNDFGELRTLEELNLEGNQFLKFPIQICRLNSLKKLYLNSCGLTRLPQQIVQLVNLSEADFSFNDLSFGLPHEFFMLPRLKQLYLIGCSLTMLPPEIGHLQQLEGLRLNENLLQSFPDELYTLRHLKKLTAVKNKISVLSPKILGLESLEMLLLMENNLTSLPHEISKLQYLLYVNVFDNKLTCLPESIIEFEPSTQLVISGNQYLQKPPLSVCNKGMESIRGFFESMQQSQPVHSNRLKMVLLGESGAGKTSLAHALVHCEEIKMTPNDSTVGVVINHWQMEPGGIEAQIVDCAGQRRYQLTHPFFLSEEALHLLVVNLKSYEKNDSSFKEHVADWIKWVTARLLKPRILIVPTHRDECEIEEVTEKCQDILDRIKSHELKEVEKLRMKIQDIRKDFKCDRSRDLKDLEKLEWQKNNRPVMSSRLLLEDTMSERNGKENAINMVPVSSLRELKGMIEIRTEIERVAKNKDLFPSVGRDLPKSWINLEQAIKEYRKGVKAPDVPCMSLQAFEIFARERSGLSGVGLLSALNYLDSIGEVKFYNNIPGLEYSVFLDLSWLGKLVKLLFRHDYEESLQFQEGYFQFQMEEILFDKCVSRLKTSGILSLQLLRCIWMELQLNDKAFEKMVKALQNFGLACAFSSSDDAELFIPWFLHSNMGDSARQMWPDIPENDLVEVRLMFAICDYLPGGLFDRLRVHCYALGIDADNWKDSILIHGGGDLMILIQVVDSLPAIVVCGRAPGQCLRELWMALLPMIKETEALLNEWPRLVYHRYSVCPRCVCSGEGKFSYFSCDWLKRKTPPSLRCRRSKKHEVKVDLLIPPQELLDEMTSSKPVSESVPEELLSDLSLEIPIHWKRLAIKLGFSQNYIDRVDADNPKVEDKANRILQNWRMKHGPMAKRSTLISALEAVEKADLIKMVKDF